MRFSEGRKSHLAHLILKTLRAEGLADVENERLALSEIKDVLEQDHSVDVRVDAAVRKKIGSLSRHVAPGTAEWDVLYRQYFEIESRKQKPRAS